MAILLNEPEADALLSLFRDCSEQPKMAAPTFVELVIVVEHMRDPAQSAQLPDYLVELGVSIEPFTADMARLAREAYHRFGRASGHPAKLNFGDSMSYALAKFNREPLLFKGQDFALTDISIAKY